MEITPLFDRVLLKPYQQEKSQSIFTLKEDETNKMIVVKVGSSTTNAVKEGEVVLINDYSASEFIVENQKFYIIKEVDILGVIK